MSYESTYHEKITPSVSFLLEATRPLENDRTTVHSQEYSTQRHEAGEV